MHKIPNDILFNLPHLVACYAKFRHLALNTFKNKIICDIIYYVGLLGNALWVASSTEQLIVDECKIFFNFDIESSCLK